MCNMCKNYCVMYFFILEMTSSDTKRETSQEKEMPGKSASHFVLEVIYRQI